MRRTGVFLLALVALGVVLFLWAIGGRGTVQRYLPPPAPRPQTTIGGAAQAGGVQIIGTIVGGIAKTLPGIFDSLASSTSAGESDYSAATVADL